MTEGQARLFDRTQVSLQTVSVSSIRPPGDGPKSSTSASIEALGFTSAILLRPKPVGSEFQYEIVDGARRYRDAIDKGIDVIPAVIVPEELDNLEMHALRVSMNLNRRANPVVEAQSLHALREHYREDGMAEADIIPHISKSLGLKQAVVEQRLRIYEIPEEIRNAVHRGEVAIGVASNVANLRPDQQQELVEHLNQTGKLTAADVSRVRLARKTADVAALPFDLFDDGDVPEPAPEPEPEPISPEMTYAGLRESFISTAATLLQDHGESVRSLRELLKEANARAKGVEAK